MRKYILLLILILGVSFVYANGEEDFSGAEELIMDKIPCSQLSDDQLELIGDFYMEQMHPGEAHKTMDEMMGGEGSENLRMIHINMAKSFYCGEHGAMSGSMMNMMMGRQGGMMGPGMMDIYQQQRNYNWFLYVVVGILVGLLLSWWIKGSKKTGR